MAMNRYVRWAIVIVAVALVVGLVGWARGNPHHHGIQVGSAPAYSSVRIG
jgi:hypothetical protein